MRFISTKTHAVNDYIFGLALIVVPLLVSDVGGPAVWVPVAIGCLMLVMSLLTNYEFSLSNLIPVKAHLAMDAIAGLALAASPWAFGFDDVVWIPHVVVGVLEIAFALFTHVHRTNPAHAIRDDRAVDRYPATTADPATARPVR